MHHCEVGVSPRYRVSRDNFCVFRYDKVIPIINRDCYVGYEISYPRESALVTAACDHGRVCLHFLERGTSDNDTDFVNIPIFLKIPIQYPFNQN